MKSSAGEKVRERGHVKEDMDKNTGVNRKRG